MVATITARARRSLLTVPLALLQLLLAAACSTAPEARSPPAERPRRHPVVLVPGFTGSELVDVTSGELAWGNGCRLLAPHDRGRGLALPLGGRHPPRLIAGAAIEEIRLLGGLVRKPIYRPLLDAFAAAGWVPGTLRAPRPGDTFLTFPYDWRDDLVATAGELLAALRALRALRGEPRLSVDLICQSSGAHLCRYLVKHGAATLDEVAAGESGLPAEIAVRHLALVGASNGGSLRIFALLHQGRRYLPGGRFFAPESLFANPSFYQDLPAEDGRVFVDPAGRPLAVDLYHPQAWVEHGWSIFAPEVAGRLVARPQPALFGSSEQRLGFLAEQLAAARRFQGALAADRPLGATRYLLVQGDRLPTPRRAVLAREQGGRWRTSFLARRAERAPGVALAVAGDGHATLASQNALSPRELAAVVAPPLRTAGRHFEMILEPATLDWLVAALAAPPSGVADAGQAR